jgi:hypothetical protein
VTATPKAGPPAEPAASPGSPGKGLQAGPGTKSSTGPAMGSHPGSGASSPAKPDEGLRICVPAHDRWLASPLSGGEAERMRLRRRYVWSGYQPEPLPSYHGPVEPPSKDRIGICCSGGGIRSAAFNLGALQSLQTAKLLQRATYLAAVSGGSYIAAAFAMVSKTWAAGKGFDEVRESERDDSDPTLFGAGHLEPFAPGSPEEQYLRNRCDYLAPDGMAKLYLGYRVVLGLLFNVAFIALPLIGATVVLGAAVYWQAFPKLVPLKDGRCANSALKHACNYGLLPTWSWAAPVALVSLSALLGLIGMLWRLRHDTTRRTLNVWSTRLLVAAFVLALLTVVLPELVSILQPSAKSTATTKATSVLAPATGGGVLALLAALSAHLRSVFGKVETGTKKVEEGLQKFKALSPKLQQLFAYAVAAIVGPLLFYAVIVLAMALTLAHATSTVHRENLLADGVGAIVLFALLYLTIDISALSLHHFYKRRLCSAFALKRVRSASNVAASRSQAASPKPPEASCESQDTASKSPQASATTPNVAQSKPRKFNDEPPRRAADSQELAGGIAMERNYDRLTPLSATKIEGGAWPTLLVCASANISDPGATPPGRHVTSFTFSPYTVGGPLVGATTTELYEQAFVNNRSRARDLTLPAAVAMSGAAVAPSMGKLTRRPLTFLLALGNIRLGVWVPNPRWIASEASWTIPWRPPRPSYLLRELLGRNRVDGRYLFVTDGGHYENLGLVELLRRGCTEIYCFDASGGESFGELGEAVALARSELGVEIKIDPAALTSGAKSSPAASATDAPATSASTAGVPTAGTPTPAANATATGVLAKGAKSAPGASGSAVLENVVRATFTYPPRDGQAAVSGVLYYARNVMTKDAPWDVQAHHLEDPSFPHDSTTDQLYTDQKFESYRMLGEQAGNNALALAGKP